VPGQGETQAKQYERQGNENEQRLLEHPDAWRSPDAGVTLGESDLIEPFMVTSHMDNGNDTGDWGLCSLPFCCDKRKRDAPMLPPVRRASPTRRAYRAAELRLIERNLHAH